MGERYLCSTSGLLATVQERDHKEDCGSLGEAIYDLRVGTGAGFRALPASIARSTQSCPGSPFQRSLKRAQHLRTTCSPMQESPSQQPSSRYQGQGAAHEKR